MNTTPEMRKRILDHFADEYMIARKHCLYGSWSRDYMKQYVTERFIIKFCFLESLKILNWREVWRLRTEGLVELLEHGDVKRRKDVIKILESKLTKKKEKSS